MKYQRLTPSGYKVENQNLWLKLNSFATVLYQFLETRTSDITCMSRDQELK